MTDVSLTRRLLLVGAAATALGAPSQAKAQDPQTAQESDPATPADRETLSRLFAAENLQIAVYAHALTLTLTPEVRAFAATALTQHRRHLATLRRINRQHLIRPDRPPRYALSFTDEARFLAVALRMEVAAVSGYGGAAVSIEVPPIYLPDLVPMIVDEMSHAARVQALLRTQPVAFTDPKAPGDLQAVIDSPEG